jgi:hypothetical protein
MPKGSAHPPFRAPLDDEEGAEFAAARLRDGRVALGSRPEGEDAGGEMHVLRPASALALAAWLAPVVEREWIGTVRERLPEQHATADDLYGDAPDALRRLARQLLDEIPPRLIARALILLANAIGPEARERIVGSLNRTTDFSEDAMLRRRLSEEREAFGYAIAAAALFDALDPDAADYDLADG